jgi:peptidoglycan/LPS O-acetylase OafA/YrhL
MANVSELIGIANPYGPLWSLAVEEHFYVVWPPIVRRAGLGGTISAAIVVLVLGMAARFVGRVFLGDRDLAYFTWYCLDGLAVGAILAAALRLPDFRRGDAARMAYGMLAVALTILGMLTCTGQLVRSSPVGGILGALPWSVLFGGMLLVLMLAATGGSRTLRAATRPRVLTFLGFISYGLYLSHVLVMHVMDHAVGGRLYALPGPGASVDSLLVRYAVVLTASIGIALVSRCTYEEWCLRRKDRVTAFLARKGKG